MSHEILVVDDDPAVRQVIEAILTEEGFSVATAADGHQALDRIAQHRPVLVLLDLQMPMMSGWTVLQQLRDANVNIPVVFMTAGYRAKSEAEQHRAAGYLAKPFELRDLLGVVQRFATPSEP